MAMTLAGRDDNEDILPYSYQPLQGKAIRLLQIPRHSIFEPWSLQSYDLKNCPPYVCLSYTWGPPLNTEECWAEYENGQRSLAISSGKNARRLRIGQNLWEGLEQLISTGQTGRLWVDAICINQEDFQERSSQVALMGSIFGGCTRVIVWLGKDQCGLDGFIWFHESLLPALEEHSRKGGDVADFSRVAEETSSDVDPLARWRGYVSFYDSHRWFHRCWILQEVARAPQVSVFCGCASLDFDEICDMALFFHDTAVDVLPRAWKRNGPQTELIKRHKGYAIGTLRALCQLPSHHDLPRVPHITGATTPLHTFYTLLLSTLSAVRGYQATNPRDKVYAALGIAMKFWPAGEEVLILPDYSLPVTEVYQSITALLVQQLPHVAVLSCVEDTSLRLLSSLPSWVPDFSPEIVDSTYNSRYEEYPYNACPSGLVGLYSRSVVGAVLHLYGGLFDTITSVVEIAHGYDQPVGRSWKDLEPNTIEMCYRLLDFCSGLDPKGFNGQSRVQALSKTIILNQIDKCPPEQDEAELFHDWVLFQLGAAWCMLGTRKEQDERFRKCCEVLRRLEEACDGTLASEDNIVLFSQIHLTKEITVVERIPAGATPEDASASTDALKNVFANYLLFNRGLKKGLFLHQKLYKTSRGCIGLGPPAMRPGDELYLICDATVPFVLRRDQNISNHILIGEAYLHGFMNGEAFTKAFVDKIEPLFVV